ncbi:WD40 repeat-like protein, partial [Suillus decipiens]
KRMEGHRSKVWRLAISRNGQFIVSGDRDEEFIVWHGETGESLTQPTKAHSERITSLDFSSDGTVLATGSWDKTTKLWNTKTWEQQEDPFKGHKSRVNAVAVFPDKGWMITGSNDMMLHVWDLKTGVVLKKMEGHCDWNSSLAWMPDGTRLLTSGSLSDPTMREWDTTTWQQVGDPWTGYTHYIHAIAINPTGTLVASASDDNHVRLWRLSDRKTVAIFKHSSSTTCITFSVDGKHILSGSEKKMISEWLIPNDINSKARFCP